MLRRPGRPSGIKLETPDSQMLGNIKLHFALTTHSASTLEANISRRAKEFLTPICTYNKIPYEIFASNVEAL